MSRKELRDLKEAAKSIINDALASGYSYIEALALYEARKRELEREYIEYWSN